MNSTKRKLYNSIVWNIFQQVDNVYDHHNATNLYKSNEHIGNTVELVKEQLRYDIKYKCKAMTIIRDQLDVYNQSWSQVYHHVDDQPLIQVYDQFRNQVRIKVYDQVWDQVDDQVKEDLKANASRRARPSS